MKGSEVRKLFLDYFQDKEHQIVKSSSLIPKNDPTLLFTNAGMVQFKNVFLGLEKRPYSRAASSQKCVRAGGKHNDLENVGVTARHHTFFEMLGNFSFGDYFKKDAIRYGWELIAEVYKLPKESLWVTVFREDEEAVDLWKSETDINPKRIVRMDEKDNFWSMGDTGPCGPCSEILIDQGESFGCDRPDCAVGCDCDRYLELWNLVFMQFDRDKDGNLGPLPNPSIDTGMGLERVAAVMQGVGSNYETDLLRGIISQVEKLSGKSYGEDSSSDVSMRVIADHARAVTFLVSDGVFPSNEGRGYVLRRILRRAVRHSNMLGIVEPCLYKITKAVKETMSESYPELNERIDFVMEIVESEEKRFLETLDRGLLLLNEEFIKLKGENVISGDVAFKLYDTYGFPVDLTQDIASEKGLGLDMAGFEKAMDEQKNKSKKAWKGSGEEGLAPLYRDILSGGLSVDFTGYDRTDGEGRITAIIKDGVLVDNANEGDDVEVITDKTPFYGESGGQMGDRGEIEGESGIGTVLDTKKPVINFIIHIVKVEKGSIWVGDKIELKVDRAFRGGVRTHHTTTHILHAVLKEILGSHVGQAGSLVAPDRLRFDFTHHSSIDQKTLNKIEDIINNRVRCDNDVVIQTDVPYDEAIEGGATAIFEEKYGDKVRIVSIGEYSKELCGGIHLDSSGEAGLVKIASEGASSAGVRRIEALAGQSAWNHMKGQEGTLGEMTRLLNVPQSEVVGRLGRLLEENESIKRELESFKGKARSEQAGKIIKNVKKVNGHNILSVEIPDTNPGDLRKVWDGLKSRLSPGVAVLGSSGDGKAFLLVGVTDDLTDKFHSGKIIKELAEIVDGKGGGKADLAQAGGNNPKNLDKALNKIYEIVERN